MFFYAVILAVFVSLLWAQDLSGLPPCAATCFIENFNNTACALTNTTCLCNDQTFYSDVQTCVLGSCNSTDILTTLNVVNAKCAAAGA